MTNIDNLNPMQKAFCDEYLKCGNKAKAAREAGYSAKTASATAVRLLKNVKIQKYIAERQKQIEDARIADVAEVMRFLTSVMRGGKGPVRPGCTTVGTNKRSERDPEA